VCVASMGSGRNHPIRRVEPLTVRMSSQARIEANGGCGTLVARVNAR
jgi:hypothetical protein